MTFSMHDWKRSTPRADVELQPWLRNPGSLTERIVQRCERFSVQNVKDGKARIAPDESAILNIAPTQLSWSREVFLLADDRPVVFAHSACSIRSLQGAWHSLRHLGNRPLGAVLFSHPEVRRLPLHYNALRAQHPLYRSAARALSNPPDRLWARRSLFYLHGEPLLVTEVFLPEILECRIKDARSG